MNVAKYFEVKRSIEKLRELSLQNAIPENYVTILKTINNSLPHTAITIKNGFTLYRSRQNVIGRLFEHVDELKYPLPKYVRSKGRFNDVDQSIFYASSSMLGTIIEFRPSINYIVTIAKIKQKNNSLIWFLPLGFRDHHFSTTPKDKTHELVLNYLNEELTKTTLINDDYNSTIAISNFFMNLEVKYGTVEIIPNAFAQKNCGLIYPSIQSKLVSNRTTQNVAMKPSLYEDFYKIIEADVYCLTLRPDYINPDTALLVPLNNGLVEDDGVIKWKFTFSEMVNRASKGIDCYAHYDQNLISLIF